MTWDAVTKISSVAWVVLASLAAVYMIPGSPIRRVVDDWIGGWIHTRFAKDIEQFKHELNLAAERVRLEHQERLHDFSLYSTKRHEVYRELYRLILTAAGSVHSLTGLRQQQTYEDYSLEDITKLMDKNRFPGETAREIISIWGQVKSDAISMLQDELRRIEIIAADRALDEARNFYLVNSLYLSDPICDVIDKIDKALRGNIFELRYPRPPHDRSTPTMSEIHSHTDALITQLKNMLRADLKAPSA